MVHSTGRRSGSFLLRYEAQLSQLTNCTKGTRNGSPTRYNKYIPNKPTQMTISIDQQVAQLAAEGHQEIAVIKLPSQATRKSRKPSKRRTPQTTNAVSQTTYTQTLSRNISKINSAYTRQHGADRRAAAQQRAAELNGQPIF